MHTIIFALAGLLFITPAFAQETPAAAAPEASRSMSRIDEALAKLPPEKAQMFDEVMRRNAAANRATQTQLRTAYSELRKNIVAPTFSKEEFMARSKEARDLQSALRASLDADLAEILSKFTQEERTIVFGALPARYTRED